MSAFIGSVRGPRHNSPGDAFEVWCSRGAVELHAIRPDTLKTLDPIAARNLASLLVRGADEAERIAERQDRREADDRTPIAGS